MVKWNLRKGIELEGTRTPRQPWLNGRPGNRLIMMVTARTTKFDKEILNLT